MFLPFSSSGKFLRVKACCPESLQNLCLWTQAEFLPELVMLCFQENDLWGGLHCVYAMTDIWEYFAEGVGPLV